MNIVAWQNKESNAYENSITQGVIWRQLLNFFFPILLGTFFQQLYNTADAVILGKFVGKQALAAAGGTTGTIINLILGFFIGLASGAMVIISQYFGGRKHKEVSETVHTAAALSLVGGIILTGLGIWLAPQMLSIMHAPDDIMEMSITYIRIYFAGMIPSLIYNIGSSILRAVGDSRRPLYFLVCACLCNVVLDIILVVGFEMGVAGAALATIISQTVSAVLVLVTLMRTPLSYRLNARDIRFHKAQLAQIVRIGLPTGIQSALYSISNIIIQVFINDYGTNTSAAWTAYGKLDGLYWMIINAFGLAITTFVGQNFGAKQYDRMKKSVWVCVLMSVIATAFLSTLFLLCGKPILGLFTSDGDVLNDGMLMVRTLAPTWYAYILIEILASALRGTGDSFAPTIITLVGVCGLRLVWLFAVVPLNNTLSMVLLCYPITWAITSIMFLIYYRFGNWLPKRIHKAGLDAEA